MRRQNTAHNTGLARQERSSPTVTSVPMQPLLSCPCLLFCRCRKVGQRQQESWNCWEGEDCGGIGALVCLAGVFWVLLMLRFLDKAIWTSPQARLHLISSPLSLWNRNKSICNLHKTILPKGKKRKGLEKKSAFFLPFSRLVFCLNFTSLMLNDFTTGFTS